MVDESTARPSQSSSTIAVESYLLKADFPPNTHTAVRLISQTAQKSAMSQGWQYDNVQEVKVKDEAETHLKRHEERFLDALHAYQDHAKPKYQTAVVLDLSTKHSWSEVLQAVIDLRTTRTGRLGFWTKLTHKFQWLGEHSAVFEQWTQLLPTQSQYFSVLCGGLKLIFGAAGRLKDVRDWICDALLELPVLLSNTEKTLDIYENADLHICCRKMMAKTFESLQWIVVELTRSAAKKGPMAFMKQESYAARLRDSLDDVQKLSEQFDRIAAICDRGKLHDVEKVAMDTQDSLSQHHFVTNENIVRTGEAVLSEVKSYLGAYLGDMAQQFRSDFKTELMGFLSAQIDSRQQILIEQAPLPPKVRSKAERRKKEAERQRRQAEHRTALLEALQYDEAVLRRDMRDNLAAIWTSTVEVQDRVHFLVAVRQLMDWLTVPSSAILLINGNGMAPERDTSTSFVAAKLVETISAMAEQDHMEYASIGLYFFCGDHTRFDADKLASPAGLLQSLIAELLSSYEGFRLKRVKKLVRAIDLFDLSQLWPIFDDLVSQLPSGIVIFCILDSITEYEFSDWRQETEYLVNQLNALSRRTAREGGCVIKVLLTSPLTTRSLHYNLERWEILEVPERVPALGGFTDNAWVASGVSGYDG